MDLGEAAEALLGTTVDMFGRTVEDHTVTRPDDIFVYADASHAPILILIRLSEGQMVTIVKVDGGPWPVHLLLEHGGLFREWPDLDDKGGVWPVLTLSIPGAAIQLLDGGAPHVYYLETTAPVACARAACFGRDR